MAKNTKDLAYQAFRTLQLAFVVIPVLAGLDKFFYLLTTWSIYISPFTMQIIGEGNDRTFMAVVGIIEIIAGIGVIFKPKFFSCILTVWLALIILNLLMTGIFFDIALRDFGLLLAAVALNRLSQNK